MLGPILQGPNELVPIWVPIVGLIIGVALPTIAYFLFHS
jgi:hypothetical protein